MNAALIGYGYWGINVAKALQNSQFFNLYSIFDLDDERLRDAKNTYIFKEFSSFQSLLNDEDIKAIFIATPPHTHFDLAKLSLNAKKFTFVEKPLATDVNSALILYELAYKNNTILYCDHVFLHSKAVIYLKKNIESFGEIACINSRRINLGLFQSRVDVFWDLAIHDLSIIEYLIGLEIKEAKKFSKKYQDFPNDALANIHLELKNNLLININVSWLSPFKIREMIIAGSKRSACYDDTKREKLSICDSGVLITSESKNSLYNQMVKYKIGNEYSPTLDISLPLDCSIDYFARKILVKKISKRESIEDILERLKLDEILQIDKNQNANGFDINLPIESKEMLKEMLVNLDSKNIFLDDESHTIDTLRAMELISKIH